MIFLPVTSFVKTLAPAPAFNAEMAVSIVSVVTSAAVLVVPSILKVTVVAVALNALVAVPVVLIVVDMAWLAVLFAESTSFWMLVMPWEAALIVWIDRKEHTSELQSRQYLVCRLLLEK